MTPPGVHDFPPPSGKHPEGELCLFPLPVRLRPIPVDMQRTPPGPMPERKRTGGVMVNPRHSIPIRRWHPVAVRCVLARGHDGACSHPALEREL